MQKKSNIKIGDKVFTQVVNWVQGNIVPVGIKLRMKRRRKNVGPPPPELQEKIVDLGLDPSRIWWGPMTLFPKKVNFLIDEIETSPPRVMLEVGSGSSTLLFAALAERYDFRVLSLENHQSSINYVRSILKGSPGEDRVILKKSDFIKRRYPDGAPYRWYDIDLGIMDAKFDFVFIDGPMGLLVGRNGAIPEILPFLASEHRIYLDDVQRPHEQDCLHEWKKHYTNLEVETFKDCPGIGRIKVPLQQAF